MKRSYSITRAMRPAEKPRSRHWVSALVIALMLALAFGGPVALPVAQVASAQETADPTPDPASQDAAGETPEAPSDPTAPQSQSGQEQTEETPPPEEEAPQETDNQSQSQSSSASNTDAATEPGAPAVLGHGLAYMTGDQVVWQVRETEIPAEAEASTSNAAVMLQRDGSTIIRNDVTGKRAKLDPGEGYFRGADDAYTAVAEGSGSVAWTFELVPSSDVADDAFYESPLINDLEEGVYDMMLTRYVLQPDESAELPAHTGPALIMVSAGEIDVEDESGLSTLAASDGQLMPGEGTVSNNSTSPAVYLVALLGDQVSDDSAAAAQAEETPAAEDGAETDTTATEETPAADAETGDATAEEEAPVEEAAPDDTGQYQTSINVTANVEIYLTITADGVTVFDGFLPAGSSSGAVVGSSFEVYTSSGVNTVFTNACGDTFNMGFEEGEVTYFLAADESSCAP
jgi:outer membrane biosynthesis protein TonB